MILSIHIPSSLKPSVALIRAFTDNSLHSGFNYVNFFGDLKGLVGFDERLAMGSIVKKSPGYVDVEGKPDTLAEITGAFAIYNKNYEVLENQYNALHSFLSKMRLLKRVSDSRHKILFAVTDTAIVFTPSHSRRPTDTDPRRGDGR